MACALFTELEEIDGNKITKNRHTWMELSMSIFYY